MNRALFYLAILAVLIVGAVWEARRERAREIRNHLDEIMAEMRAAFLRVQIEIGTALIPAILALGEAFKQAIPAVLVLSDALAEGGVDVLDPPSPMEDSP